jgi:hypothetical protein
LGLAQLSLHFWQTPLAAVLSFVLGQRRRQPQTNLFGGGRQRIVAARLSVRRKHSNGARHVDLLKRPEWTEFGKKSQAVFLDPALTVRRQLALRCNLRLDTAPAHIISKLDILLSKKYALCIFQL